MLRSGNKFDIVFDTPGKLSFRAAKAILKPGYRILDLNATPLQMLTSIFSPAHQTIVTTVTKSDRETLADLASAGNIKASIGAEVSLNGLIDRLKAMEEGERTT